MSEQRRTPIETDALGAIHKELVIAARRRKSVREHRRRLATIAATIVATLACVAGASALTDIGTGIPPIDRFLGTYEGNLGRSAHGPPGHRPASQLDAVPKVGGEAVAVEVPWGSEPHGAVGSLYVSAMNHVCFALTQPPEPDGDVVRGNQEGCYAPRVLSRRLDEEQVFISGIAFGASTIVHGYAAPHVSVLDVTGPNGAFEVRVSKVLTPGLREVGSLRLFMAYVDAPALDRSSTSDYQNPRRYSVTARLPNGRIVERSPLSGEP